MKNLLFLFILLLVLLVCIGCTKNPTIQEETKIAARAGFSTSVNLGPDIISPKTDSLCLCNTYVYLNTCGVNPEYEAPVKGFDLYQISGPNIATIKFATVGFQDYPQVTNLTVGKYTFVGHAYVLGFRACDSTLMEDNVYDTINVTINKNRKPIKR